MQGSYLGPGYAQQDIERRLTACRAKFEVPSSQEEMLDSAASLLADGKVVGWFQGRMEFGPRALGARSILGDPRSESMQKTMNLKIKYRESFRPFAPSVLREDVNRYFETDMDSPYMLLVDRIKPELCRQMSEEESKLFGIDKLNVRRSDLPAITHVDYTARVQTVHTGHQPALPSTDQPVQAKDRVWRGDQYLLQRARRTTGVFPGRCIQVLHGHGDGCAGGRQLHPAQGTAGSVAEAGLHQRLRPRLRAKPSRGIRAHEAGLGRVIDQFDADVVEAEFTAATTCQAQPDERDFRRNGELQGGRFES